MTHYHSYGPTTVQLPAAAATFSGYDQLLTLSRLEIPGERELFIAAVNIGVTTFLTLKSTTVVTYYSCEDAAST